MREENQQYEDVDYIVNVGSPPIFFKLFKAKNLHNGKTNAGNSLIDAKE